MKVLIIEDESLAAQRLERLIKKYDAGINILSKITSIKEAVTWFGNNQLPDLIFMDIKLEDGNSFEIFKKIKVNTPVIFTTVYEDYMVNAFKVHSIDYLLKPVNLEELSFSINKFKELQLQFGREHLDSNKLLSFLQPNRPTYKNHFMIIIGKKVKTFGIEEIAYFYFDEKITFVVMNDNEKYPVDYSLDSLTELLDPSLFFRVNRQFIVKRNSISKIELHPKCRFLLTMEPHIDKKIIVSSYRSADFKNWLDS